MLVSVVCPCRNEASHIDTFLQDLSHQEAGGFDLEFLVADGLSDDGTSQILHAWSARDRRLKIIQNAARIVSTGLNAALAEARGDIIVRMDVHTEYAPDYVAQCVSVLDETGAMCVGGPWHAKGKSDRQRAIAAAFGSAFGSGGAKSRQLNYTGPAETVYLGAWRRTDLISLGGFDEELVCNQDDELCLRIARKGGLIWQSKRIRSRYLARDSLGKLWKQFYEYGYWRAVVIRKHLAPSSLRQLAPGLFVGLLLVLAICGFVVSVAWLFAAALIAAYMAAALIAAFRVNDGCGLRSRALVVLSFICMHFGYGFGSAKGAVDSFLFDTRRWKR